MCVFRRYGIECVGISSDGDTRLLSAMHSKNHYDLNEPTEENLIEYSKKFSGIVYIQDTIHVGTKLRNRLLKDGIILPMGNTQVSIAHIKMLIDNVPKDVHGLVYSDICPQDRQNFSSLEKVMENRVLNALKKYIPYSEATIEYLKICKQVTSCFLSADLTPLERVYELWKSIYFPRIWRQWLKYSENSYEMDENGISSNAYECIEVNGHGLISAIQFFRDINQPELFIPCYFSSQPCENMFRKMRSMGSVNFTKINFTLYELIHMIRRVELLNEITYLRLQGQNIVFPRIEKYAASQKDSQSSYKLPSDTEIKETLIKAKINAMEKATSLEMTTADSNAYIDQCSFTTRETKSKRRNSDSVPVPDDSEPIFTKWVEVLCEDGTTKTILKSTLVWLLTETKGKLSSDKLKRVQEMTSNSNTKRRRLISNLSNEHKEIELIKSDELSIGDWCFFKYNPDSNECEEPSDQNIMQYCVLGNILGFKADTTQNEIETSASTSAEELKKSKH